MWKLAGVSISFHVNVGAYMINCNLKQKELTWKHNHLCTIYCKLIKYSVYTLLQINIALCVYIIIY